MGPSVIVDGTTLRPNVLQLPQKNASTPAAPLIAWGSDSSTLYVESDVLGTSPVEMFTVDANGIASTPGPVTFKIDGPFAYDRSVHRLFGSYDGTNFDEQGNSRGTFALPTDGAGRTLACPMVADGADNKVFFACATPGIPLDTGPVTLLAFDATTSAPLGTVVLDKALSAPSAFVRSGANELTVVSANQLFVVAGSFVH